jgi:hypothetical protein
MTQQSPRPLAEAPPRRGRSVWNLAVGTLALVLAAGWFVLTRTAFDAGTQAQLREHLGGAERFFTRELSQRQQRLQAECQLITEDPRLKSALAIQGIDRATLEDILAGLRKQASTDVLALLTPTAQVQASEGFEGMAGLDLSSAALIRAARDSGDAVAGNWVLKEELFDVAVRAIRVDEQVVAYLVLGARLTPASLEALREATGTGAALLIAGKAGTAFPSTPPFQSAFASLAREPGTVEPQRRAYEGAEAMVQVVEVPRTVPPVRLALVRPVEDFQAPFSRAWQLLWLPPVFATILGALAIARGRLLD